MVDYKKACIIIAVFNDKKYSRAAVSVTMSFMIISHYVHRFIKTVTNH